MFASSTTFQPTEIRRFIKPLGTGASATLVETDAGKGYLKALGNRGGPHVLACELVGTHLASCLGLPTFDYALIDVTELDEIRLYDGQMADTGPAFITRLETGSTWGGDAGMLKNLSDTGDISRMVCLDTWLLNPDRYGPNDRTNMDNVFFSSESNSDKFQLKMMDFTHAFTNGRELTARVADIDTIRDDGIYSLFKEFRPLLEQPVVREFCELLSNLSIEVIDSAVSLIPREWEVSQDAREALTRLIRHRANYISETLEDRLFPVLPPQMEISFPDSEDDQ